jgi:quercetin dioxygenase-like cupin family protein
MTKTTESLGGGQVIPHGGLHETETGVVGAGSGSKVFHLDDTLELASLHDGRRKRVLLNSANTGAGLLVDVVMVAPGSSSPLHYHKGTEHFFFIIDGRGHITISGQDHPLRRGSIAWIADGDPHQVFADANSSLTFLEYFSQGRHETVFLGQACEWKPDR